MQSHEIEARFEVQTGDREKRLAARVVELLEGVAVAHGADATVAGAIYRALPGAISQAIREIDGL